MTDPARPPSLLRSDEEEIARAARVLSQGKGFFVVVCGAALRGGAEACFARHGVGEGKRFELRSGEDVLDALRAIAEDQGIRALTIGDRAKEVFQALNWHREKLLRGTAVVLWLEDLEALGQFREIAPDAYAFRDAVVMLRGDGGALPKKSKDEPPELSDARKRFKRAKTALQRAQAAAILADQLRRQGSYAEAAELVTRSLFQLPDVAGKEREIRVQLLFVGASAAREREAFAVAHTFAHRALAEAALLPFSQAIEWEARIWPSVPGPFGSRDITSTRRAVELSRSFGLHPNILGSSLSASALVEGALGRVALAGTLASEALSLAVQTNEFNAAVSTHVLAHVKCWEGRLIEGEKLLRDAIAAFSAQGGMTDFVLDSLLGCFLDRGELDVAERLADSFDDPVLRARATAYLSLLRGDAIAATSVLADGAKGATAEGRDGRHRVFVGDLVALVEAVARAELLDPVLYSSVLPSIDVAEDVSISITGRERPAWYPILFRCLRARAVALMPDRLEEAIRLDHESVTLARGSSLDLVPQGARLLADHLLLAGRLEQARAVAEEHQLLARERLILRDLVNLIVLEIAARCRLGEAPEGIDRRISSLREVLAEGGSQRMHAEAILDLLVHLPPDTPHPDMLVLASEAHALFAEMPMPESEARCLEVAGDVLLARGKPAEAKRRYLLAYARLERLGLRLRLPLLTKKIEQVPSS
jgi:tetratricopeptide (TPR) repeat protein